MVIPAAIGAVICLLLVRGVAELRHRMLGVGLAAAGLVAALFVTFRDRFELPDLSNPGSVQAILDLLGRSQNPFLPSQWLASGVLAAATGDFTESVFQLFLLVAHAGMALLVATFVA
ncbi:MAG: hypothetical protein AAGF23_10570, partial [Acidobacteriota bacterium]